MQRAWDEIARLVRENATHRRGWKLGDAPPSMSIAHARDELAELADSPDDVTELADILGCLIVYAVKKGWSAVAVEEVLLMKLSLRFSRERA